MGEGGRRAREVSNVNTRLEESVRSVESARVRCKRGEKIAKIRVWRRIGWELGRE